MLQMCEIYQQPDRIELWPFERHAHAVIMPVRVLAFAFVSAQRMARGKSLFNADLKHISPK